MLFQTKIISTTESIVDNIIDDDVKGKQTKPLKQVFFIVFNSIIQYWFYVINIIILAENEQKREWAFAN